MAWIFTCKNFSTFFISMNKFIPVGLTNWWTFSNNEFILFWFCHICSTHWLLETAWDDFSLWRMYISLAGISFQSQSQLKPTWKSDNKQENLIITRFPISFWRKMENSLGDSNFNLKKRNNSSSYIKTISLYFNEWKLFLLEKSICIV